MPGEKKTSGKNEGLKEITQKITNIQCYWNPLYIVQNSSDFKRKKDEQKYVL